MPNQFDEVIRLALDIEGTGDVAALQKALEAVGQSGTEAAPKAKALADALEKLGAQNTLIETLVKEKAALQETGDALSLTKIKLADLQKQLSATTTPSAALQKSFDRTQASVVSLDAAYNQHTATITKTNNALAAAGVSTTNLDSAQRGVQASIAGVASEASNLGKNMGTVAVATEEAGAKAAETGGLFATLKNHLVEIVSIAAAVELALKGIEFGSESLKGAEQVEASLSRVKALATGAADSFGDLDQAVEDAARSVNVTTQTSANGLAALASQGLSTEQSIKTLIPTLQIAKIAQEDVSTSAATVAQLIKAYGEQAGSASDIVDKLTAASHGAAGGLGEMSKSAARLAPDAKAIGLGFDDVVGALGLLASKGIEGEKSVEGLRNIFQQLHNPTSDLRVQLIALGDGTSDFSKAVTALGQNSPLARDALNSLDGSARSLVQALIQSGPDAISKFAAGLQNTQGLATKTAAAIDDNLLGAATRFGNAIDRIGEQLVAPILKPFTDELVKLAGQLDAFAQSPDFASIKQSVSEMATKAAAALDQFINNTDWKGFAEKAKSSIDGISKSLDGLQKSASALATTIGKVSDTVGAAYHGVGVAIDGVVAVAAKGTDALVTTAEKLSGIKQDGSDAAKGLENVHSALQTLGDSATDNFEKNSAAVVENLKDVAGIAPDAADGVQSVGDAASTAAPAMAAHAAASKTAADASTQLSDSLKLVPQYVDATATSVSATVPYVNHLADAVDHLQGGPLQDARKALADASKAFADLNAKGSATPEQMDQVSGAVIKASADLQKLQAAASAAGGSIEGAFKGLGIVSQQQVAAAIVQFQAWFDTIKNGSDQSATGIANVANAFLAMAQKELSVSALLDQAAQDEVRRNLESQAAALGLQQQLSQLESQAGRTGSALSHIGEVKPPQNLVSGFSQISSAAGTASRAVADATDNAEKGFTEWGDAADAAALATQHITADTSHANEGMDALVQGIKNARDGFLAVSDAAAHFYDITLKAAFDAGHSDDGSGFDRVARAMQQALDITTKKIADQRTQLSAEIGVINELGTASSKGFGAFGDNADIASARMQSLSNLIKEGKYNADLLGQADLATLQHALEAAAERAKQLADAAAGAAAQLADINNQLLDQIDQSNGNQKDLEGRRFQQQLKQIQDLYKQSGKLGTDDYNQAVANANKLHALKLKQIQDEQAAQDGAAGSSSAPKPSGSGGIGGGGTGSGTGGAGLGGAPTVNITMHVQGSVVGGTTEDIVNKLAPQVVDALKRIQGQSRVNIFTGKAA